MNYLLTGSTGFLGNHIKRYLEKIGKVVTLGRGDSNDIQVASIYEKIQQLSDLKIDVVIHAAGKAHMTLKTEDEKSSFFQINLDGTINLCDWIDQSNLQPKVFIFTSTVSVYGIDSGAEILESFTAIPKTAYGKSKLLAEHYLEEWSKKNNVKLLILRLPLVVGSNPPGNLGKMIKGIKHRTYFSIGGGKARKSMVLAEDVAYLIANCPELSGVYNLTDGYHPSFAELEAMICEQLKRPKPFNMSLSLAKILGKMGDLLPRFPVNSDTIDKITQDLTFSDVKARQELGWNPSRVIDKWKI